METVPVSNIDFDLASVLPYRVLHSEHQFLPDGLQVIGGRLLHHNWSFQLPVYREHVIGGPLQDVASVCGRVQQSFHVNAKPGDVFIVPQGEPAAYHYTCEANPAIFLLFLAPEILHDVALRSFERDPDRIEVLVRNGTPDPLIHALGRTFISELQSGGTSGNLCLETLTQMLAVHVLRQHTTRTLSRQLVVPERTAAGLQRALEFIDAHLNQQLTLDAVAAEVHLSPYHLTRAFKQALGVPLYQYVIAQRIERGRRLLESGTYTIGEVARLVGFADHSHFTRHFRRRYGTPPSAIVKKRKTIQL